MQASREKETLTDGVITRLIILNARAAGWTLAKHKAQLPRTGLDIKIGFRPPALQKDSIDQLELHLFFPIKSLDSFILYINKLFTAQKRLR